MKKKSGIFNFRVNDILRSILSALHPFLTLRNDVLKHKRGTFFSVSSDLMKGTKMRDDAMMILISVKIARMYVNGFNTLKDNCLNSGT